jgi:hypothetical protein
MKLAARHLELTPPMSAIRLFVPVAASFEPRSC